MKITNINLKKFQSTLELSANIEGERLWYRFPSNYNIGLSADPFIAANFFPAMSAGGTLEIEKGVVSPKLLEGVDSLLEIYKCWNPLLNRFSISGDEGINTNQNVGVASFFSGGVDGLYTLKLHQDEITHLIYINGFDFQMIKEEFDESVKRHSQIAKLYNKILIPVETNHYSYMQQMKISRPLNHGSCLASVALSLGFEKIYIPSSYSYRDLHPWGSHPLTDFLWSTERTQIIHDICTERSEKIRFLFEDKNILNNLIVCWNLANKNCCKCGKCVRTMITLEILGLQSPSFSRKLTLRDISKVRSNSYSDLSFLYDNFYLAKSLKKYSIAKALSNAIKKSSLKLDIKHIDKIFLSSFLKKMYHLLRYGRVEHKDESMLNLSPSLQDILRS